jgi:hypothetical protein
MRWRKSRTLTVATVAVAAGATTAGLLAATAFAAPGQPARAAHPASQRQGSPSYEVREILYGANLKHTNSHTAKSEALSDPTGITQYGGDVYAAFDNGVGSQGQASATGNLDSTIVEFTQSGSVLGQWDVAGQAAGLAANSGTGEVIVTVNPGANSSIYSIEPGSGVVHYAYSEALPSKGGTGEVTFFNSQLLVTASAPGTTGTAAPQASYPAVYSVTLNQTTHVATVKAYYYDEAAAKIANSTGPGSPLGTNVSLALTAPASVTVVPSVAPRWRNFLVVTSGSDQVYSSVSSSLWELKLAQPVGDMAVVTSWNGALFATDQATDSVDLINGRPIWPGTAFIVVQGKTSTLARLNLLSGQILTQPTWGASLTPENLIFVPSSS